MSTFHWMTILFRVSTLCCWWPDNEYFWECSQEKHSFTANEAEYPDTYLAQFPVDLKVLLPHHVWINQVTFPSCWFQNTNMKHSFYFLLSNSLRSAGHIVVMSTQVGGFTCIVGRQLILKPSTYPHATKMGALRGVARDLLIIWNSIVSQDGKLPAASLKLNLHPQWEYQFWECRTEILAFKVLKITPLPLIWFCGVFWDPGGLKGYRLDTFAVNTKKKQLQQDEKI